MASEKFSERTSLLCCRLELSETDINDVIGGRLGGRRTAVVDGSHNVSRKGSRKLVAER